MPVPFLKDESFNSYLSNRPVSYCLLGCYCEIQETMKAKNVCGMCCVARGKSQSHEITKRD